MIYKCKYCGSGQTHNVIQDIINDIILSGRSYIRSDGTKAKYKKPEWCECEESKLRRQRRQDVKDEL